MIKKKKKLVHEETERDFMFDVKNEPMDENNSMVYNKRRCTSSDNPQNNGNGNGAMNEPIHKNGNYNNGGSMQNMPSSHHNINKSMNSRIDSPRNQSLNNRLSSNSPRDIAIPMNNGFHMPTQNNQRTHSLNNPLKLNNGIPPPQNQPPMPLNSENIKHTRRTSSLGMMKESSKRNSMGYSPVNKFGPNPSNNRNSMISDSGLNEINRPPRILSGKNLDNVQPHYPSSSSSYSKSPNYLPMEMDQKNPSMNESSNSTFYSQNEPLDKNSMNGTNSSIPLPNNPNLMNNLTNSTNNNNNNNSNNNNNNHNNNNTNMNNNLNNNINNNNNTNMYTNSYSNLPSTRSSSSKGDMIRSVPSISSNRSDFTLRDIDNDGSFTLRSGNSVPDEDLINRNNTYPLNKNVLENNESQDPLKSYTVPKNHGKNPMFGYEGDYDMDYYSNANNKQNSIPYLLNPSKRKQMQDQMIPINEKMDIS